MISLYDSISHNYVTKRYGLSYDVILQHTVTTLCMLGLQLYVHMTYTPHNTTSLQLHAYHLYQRQN